MKIQRSTAIRLAYILLAAPLVIAAILLTGCASAPVPLQSYSTQTQAPHGCYELSDCGSPQTAGKSNVSEHYLQSVLSDAFSGHTYIKDDEQYGREHWTKSLTGDCEDFALWVRDKLAQDGVASDLVFLAIPGSDYHVVVHVNGYILDNRYKWVMRQEELNYKWLMIGKSTGGWWPVKTETASK